MRRAAAFLLVCLISAPIACAPAIRSTATTPLTELQMAELWQEPTDITDRDLFWGPWGERYAPKPGQRYEFLAEKTTGFSPGFDVRDDNGTEWSVKLGSEAGVEVVVSRILSAVGYHQPPVYYVSTWTIHGGNVPQAQKPARFRPKKVGLKDLGEWSWQQNPFVGTTPYGGLLALMMLVNGTDLKNSNNTFYALESSLASSDVERWYVVRDVGASLGETGVIAPDRGDPFKFEKLPFILGVQHGFVRFDYHGLHKKLVEQLTPDDVHWMADLVGKLTDTQWHDAFRAGGYGPAASDAFIKRIHERLEEARSL